MPLAKNYVFGVFALDPENRRLRRDGVDLSCGPQAFDLLHLLVANAGNLVTRQRIREALWTDRTIDFDQAINGSIRELRALLGDDRTVPAFIKTAPKHGYVFVAPVRERSKFESPTRFTAVLATLMGLTAIAVLILAGGERPPKPDGATHIPSPAALAAFIDGDQLLQDHSAGGAAGAERLFRVAIENDPAFALAWAGLADALFSGGPGLARDIEGARAAVEHALLLHPDLPRALARRAEIRFMHDWAFAAARRDFERALAMAPNDASIRHGFGAFLLATDRPSQAVAELHLALSIDPRSAVVTHDLAWTLSLSGRHLEALQLCEALDSLAPRDMRALACRFRPLLGLGRTAEAAGIAREWMHRLGREASSQEPAALLEEFWRWRVANSHDPFATAIAKARLGDMSGALEDLRDARNGRSALMPFAHLYPEFVTLVQNAEFRALVAVSGEPPVAG